MVINSIYDNYKNDLKILDKTSSKERSNFLKKYPISIEIWLLQLSNYISNKSKSLDKIYNKFQKAFKYIKFSVKLNILFFDFIEKNYIDKEFIQHNYEIQLSIVGSENESLQLWENYIAFLMQNNNYIKVDNIYWSLLSNKIANLKEIKIKYVDFINKIDFIILKNILQDKQIPYDILEEGKKLLLKKFELQLDNILSSRFNKDHFEDKIKNNLIDDEKKNVYDYINYFESELKLSDNEDNKCLNIIEKALIDVGFYIEIWKYYIDYLRYDLKDYNYLLKKLKLYRKFLLNFGNLFLFIEFDYLEIYNLKKVKKIFNLYAFNDIKFLLRKLQFINRNYKFNELKKYFFRLFNDNIIEKDQDMLVLIDSFLYYACKNKKYNKIAKYIIEISNYISYSDDYIFIILKYYFNSKTEAEIILNENILFLSNIYSKYNNYLSTKRIIKQALIDKLNNIKQSDYIFSRVLSNNN